MEIIALLQPSFETVLSELAQSDSAYDAKFARHLLELLTPFDVNRLARNSSRHITSIAIFGYSTARRTMPIA